MSDHSKEYQNQWPFWRRFYVYQAERFPILGHGLLIASFTFSAISYSRICRGMNDFVSWHQYVVAVLTTLTLFLLVRIFDEFKDQEDDAKFRKELPVPRGLIMLKELLVVGVFVFVFQVLLNASTYPVMLGIYALVITYLCLMGKEFFVAEWLKKHQFWYVVSHMLIIPLVDVYASGFDWLLAGVAAPTGLVFFFAVSFMNGVVLEIGRKIRTPEQESEGVLTYSSMLGTRKATWAWLGVLLVTLSLSIIASYYASHGISAYIVLISVFFLCALPAILFLNKQTAKTAKMIEYASALWTIAMYLTLGGIPMLQKIFFQ